MWEVENHCKSFGGSWKAWKQLPGSRYHRSLSRLLAQLCAWRGAQQACPRLRQPCDSNASFFFFCFSKFENTNCKVGSTLAKAAALRVNLSIDGAPITSRAHTHPSHSQTSRIVPGLYINKPLLSINLVSIFRCSSSATNRGHTRRVDSSTLVCSLSSHRHSFIGFVFSSRFNDS